MRHLTRRTLRIATRSTPMALAQAARVVLLLRSLDPALGTEILAVPSDADRPRGDLAEIGGKATFTKRIDLMVGRGEADLAVHCLKDVPGDTPLPDGLVLAACLTREDARDVLVLPEDDARRSLRDLPSGAVVGTSSVRREAQIRRLRPDLDVVPVRGAVGSRIRRLDHRGPLDLTGEKADALVLALSGLIRLGAERRARQVFSPCEILPAVGSGVLVLHCRSEGPVQRLLGELDDKRTRREVTAERVMLEGLGGHCNSPIAGHCLTRPDGRLELRGMVFSRDGSTLACVHLLGTAQAGPTDLGARVRDELLRRGAGGIIDGTRR